MSTMRNEIGTDEIGNTSIAAEVAGEATAQSVQADLQHADDGSDAGIVPGQLEEGTPPAVEAVQIPGPVYNIESVDVGPEPEDGRLPHEP